MTGRDCWCTFIGPLESREQQDRAELDRAWHDLLRAIAEGWRLDRLVEWMARGVSWTRERVSRYCRS